MHTTLCIFLRTLIFPAACSLPRFSLLFSKCVGVEIVGDRGEAAASYLLVSMCRYILCIYRSVRALRDGMYAEYEM